MKVSLNNIRISPRKVRLVINLIRGKSLVFAEQQLRFMHKAAAGPILKMIRSAKANAENNFETKSDTLYIKSIIANEGPTLTRYSPKAFGRADVVRKRSTHIHAVIAERDTEKKAAIAKNTKKSQKQSAPKDKKVAQSAKEKGAVKAGAQTKAKFQLKKHTSSSTKK